MTYEEIKQKLAVCEKALNSIKNGGYKNISEKTLNKITTIKEGLTKLMKEQEDTSPGIVQTDDESKAEKLAQKGISVQLTNEDKGIQFNQNQTALIARSVGKALGRALIDGGSELESMRGTRIRPNSFDIHVIFKDNNEDDFSFYIQDDKLHLQDINLDKILVDIGTKPDGSGLVNKDVLKNEFQKHFKSLNEYDRDADWSDEEQYDFEIGDEVELRGPYEENPGEVFTISHTGSRGQFWIADEKGRGWYVYPSQIKPAEEAVYENTSELAGYTRRGTKELEVEPSKFKGRDKSKLRGLKEGDLVYLDDGDIDFLKSFVARMGHDKDPVKGEEFTKLKQILQSIIRSQEEDTLTLQEGTELWDDDKFTFKRFYMGKEGMGLQITTRAGKYIVLKGDDVKQFARAAVHVAQEFENLDHQVPINESPSVAKLQKRHSEIVSKMKELAKEYKKGDHSVVDKLKELNSEKKQIVDLLDQSVSNIGRGQQLAEFVGGELEKRSDAYFEKLVPGSGSAGTVEGEMLRAINRIIYRWYNDGDWFFRGYGVETAAPAMAFLRDSNEIPHDIRVNLNRLEDEAVQNDGNEKGDGC